MSKSTMFTVKDPVYTHTFPASFKVMDDMVNELPLRKPTGLDMLEVGTPVKFDSATGEADLDIPKSYAMLARLSNMPEKILLNIDTAEILDLFWMQASFFMRGRQALLPALEKQRAELLASPASLELSPDDSTLASL